MISGPVASGVVVRMTSRDVEVAVSWDVETPATPGTPGAPEAPVPAPLTVFIGHPRPPVLARLWRDLASLAVARIVVFTAALSEPSYRQSRIWHAPQQYLHEGLSQGGHTALPDLQYAPTLREALQSYAGGAGFFGALQTPGAVRVHQLESHMDSADDTWVLVGPERGLIPREDREVREARGFPVSLGATVLRTETAVMLLAGVAVSVLTARGNQRVAACATGGE